MQITLPADLSQQLKQLADARNLTPEQLVRDMLASYPQPTPNQPKKRTLGLGKGTVWMSEDFDDELGDDFWLGKE